MPNVAQVRMAAYRVMREVGLHNVTIAAVRQQMLRDGARPGSHRDLPKMVRDFKDEQSDIVRLPPAAVKLVEECAIQIWRMAFAAADERDLQRGGAQPEPQVIRKRRPKPTRGTPRVVTLQKAIEFIFRPDAKGSSLVGRPIAAIDVYRRLTDKQARLTSESHIGRDLKQIEKRSRLLYRVTNKSSPSWKSRWWRNDRPLPVGYGEKKVTRYVPRGTALSQTRMANRPAREDAIAYMITSKRPVSQEELIEALRVPVESREKFKMMLRNGLRGKNSRFARDVDGRFSLVRRTDVSENTLSRSPMRRGSADVGACIPSLDLGTGD